MDRENETAANFLAKHDLRCESFGKQEMNLSKTPDFRVFHNGAFAFFCEVKSIARDELLDRQVDEAPPGQLVGGARPDPTYNRIESKIHEAVQQFDAVNPSRSHSNVLIFLNHDRMADYNDLRAVLTGGIPTKEGGVFQGFTKYSEGRIRAEKDRIDLYIWLEEDGKRRLHFAGAPERHFSDLCRLFGVDQSKIKSV